MLPAALQRHGKAWLVEQRRLAMHSAPTVAHEGTAHFAFWRTYLLVASTLLVLQAVSWIVFGSFDPFGLYTSLMARAFFGSARLPAEAQKTFSRSGG
jgi:hypothetical protein